MSRNKFEKDENFYLLLELDFDKPETDNAVISAAIKVKKAEWNKTSVGVKEARALKYRGMLDEMTALMCGTDIGKIKEEALAAQKIVYEPLDKKIALLIQKKEVKESEISFLSEKYKLDKAIIKKRIPSGTPIIDDSKTSAKTETELDVTIANKITDYLAIVKKTDLYDFLGLKSYDSCEVLRTKGNSLYLKYNDIKPRTAEIDSNVKLAGNCKICFEDETQKAKYDAFLKTQLSPEIMESIDLAAAAPDGEIREINRADSNLLIKQIMEIKCSYDEAIHALKKYCLKKKYFLSLTEIKGNETPFKLCGKCGAVIEMGNGNSKCTHCGTPLEVECPRPQCKTKNDSSNNNCSKCGFSLKSMFQAITECEKAKSFIDKMMFDEAKSTLARAASYWPGYPHIDQLTAELNNNKLLLEQNVEKLTQNIEKKQYFAANQELKILKQKSPTYNNQDVIGKIQNAIKEAETWGAKARALTDEKEIIEYCSKALTVCSDYQAAKEMIVRFPPLPASGLSVTQSESSNIIRWQPSKSEGSITYKLLKKNQAIPQNESDGELLVETSTTSFEDIKLIACVPTYYAVFTCRGGITSRVESSATPAYSYLNVTDIITYAGDRDVNISWKLPNGAKTVEVWKKEGSQPTKRGDGVKMPVSLKEAFVDSNIKNGTTYFYLVNTIYQTTTGEVASRGVIGKAIPSSPPQAVKDLALEKNADGSYSLRWSKAEKGQVVVYYSIIPIKEAVGTCKPQTEIEKLLRPLGTTYRDANSIKFKFNAEGVFYLCPILFVNNMGVYGEQIRVASVADFKDLKKPRFSGDKLFLEFSWPEQAKKALILARFDEYAVRPDDGNASRELITKLSYATQAAAVIKNIAKMNYYLTIYAVYGDSKNPVYSSGIKVMALNEATVEIQYKVKAEKTLPGIFGKVKGISLTVSSNIPISSLPTMQLVKKSGSMPLNKTDGIVVMTITNNSDLKQETYTSSDTNNAARTYYKLFFTDDTNYNLYKLLTPDVKSLLITR